MYIWRKFYFLCNEAALSYQLKTFEILNLCNVEIFHPRWNFWSFPLKNIFRDLNLCQDFWLFNGNLWLKGCLIPHSFFSASITLRLITETNSMIVFNKNVKPTIISRISILFSVILFLFYMLSKKKPIQVTMEPKKNVFVEIYWRKPNSVGDNFVTLKEKLKSSLRRKDNK